MGSPSVPERHEYYRDMGPKRPCLLIAVFQVSAEYIHIEQRTGNEKHVPEVAFD
jgi:hypothetical protein